MKEEKEQWMASTDSGVKEEWFHLVLKKNSGFDLFLFLMVLFRNQRHSLSICVLHLGKVKWYIPVLQC